MGLWALQTPSREPRNIYRHAVVFFFVNVSCSSIHKLRKVELLEKCLQGFLTLCKEKWSFLFSYRSFFPCQTHLEEDSVEACQFCRKEWADLSPVSCWVGGEKQLRDIEDCKSDTQNLAYFKCNTLPSDLGITLPSSSSFRECPVEHTDKHPFFLLSRLGSGGTDE